MKKNLTCRFCSEQLEHLMCDLGMTPLANSYVREEEAHNSEMFYPLKVWICKKCLLAQLQSYEKPDFIFEEYLYYSSYSSSWVEHARLYSDMVIDRFGLNEESQVVEIASNDGYLLQHFISKGIPVIGVEPAKNIANFAINEKHIPCITKFFGMNVAKEIVANDMSADLLVGNNVLAHVPDINDFVEGMKIVLKMKGLITMEFPHLLRLIKNNQFDTIYHEHLSYLSLLAVERIFAKHELKIFDVEEISTHGGSLRIFACHADSNCEKHAVSSRVSMIKEMEIEFGLCDLRTYTDFGEKVKSTKMGIIKFLLGAKEDGKSVVAYGAAAKGVTLSNYCGIRNDLVDYVVDKSPHKQNHFMPGVRIPIYSPELIIATRPDYILIFPWNLAHEIRNEISMIREWGGKFVIPIPELTILA